MTFVQGAASEFFGATSSHRLSVVGASPDTQCEMVGVPGFEPGAPCSQSRCATRLRYTPTRRNLFVESRSVNALVISVIVAAHQEEEDARVDLFIGARVAHRL